MTRLSVVENWKLLWKVAMKIFAAETIIIAIITVFSKTIRNKKMFKQYNHRCYEILWLAAFENRGRDLHFLNVFERNKNLNDCFVSNVIFILFLYSFNFNELSSRAPTRYLGNKFNLAR